MQVSSLFSTSTCLGSSCCLCCCPPKGAPLAATEKYFRQACQQASSNHQAAMAAAVATTRCMLAMDATVRESDLRSWKMRNQVRTVLPFQTFSETSHLTCLCVCQEPSVFPRVALRMEDNVNRSRVFYVNQFVLHSVSRFYEGLLEFRAEQQQHSSDSTLPTAAAAATTTGTDQAAITIPAECTTDPRLVLLTSSVLQCQKVLTNTLKHKKQGGGGCHLLHVHARALRRERQGRVYLHGGQLLESFLLLRHHGALRACRLSGHPGAHGAAAGALLQHRHHVPAGIFRSTMLKMQWVFL